MSFRDVPRGTSFRGFPKRSDVKRSHAPPSSLLGISKPLLGKKGVEMRFVFISGSPGGVGIRVKHTVQLLKTVGEGGRKGTSLSFTRISWPDR